MPDNLTISMAFWWQDSIILTDSENIKYIAKNSENKICLDLSHSAMFCNYKNIDLYDFVGTISACGAYAHK